MIVTDLDRSLLLPDRTISVFAQGVLRQCLAHDIRIVFATARPEASCHGFVEAVRPDALISFGGSLTRMNGKAVRRVMLDSETANRLLLMCLSACEGGYVTADTADGYYVNNPVNRDDSGWAEYPPVIPMDFSKGLNRAVYQISAELPDRKCADRIVSAFPGLEATPFRDEKWFRFAHASAGKLDSIRALADILGIGLEEVAAFGDDYGDIGMLSGCGIGVAVENAVDEVKAAADYVCGANHDDGVAKWIATHILAKQV